MAAIRPATQSGLGADTARGMRPVALAVGLAAGVGITVFVTGWWAPALVGGALAGTAAVGWLAVRKIGGLAGDVLGATEQVVECLVLVIASGLAARHAVWWS
jgi:adenosylcobinamide-GDP ribazoletransferase